MVNVVDVGILGSNEDVTARKAQEPIAAATFGEVEGHRPLSVGPGHGRDGARTGVRGLTTSTSGSRSRTGLRS